MIFALCITFIIATKKNTTVKKTTKIESLETLRKINNSAQKIKNSYLQNFSSFLGFMT